MAKKNIVILGSTGSIGVQALDIVREHRDVFNVMAISCNSSWETLTEQINEFEPEYALTCDEDCASKLNEAETPSSTQILTGTDKLSQLTSLEDADIILNALVGFSGFEPTVSALKAGKKVALANKESLVVGGALINDLLKEHDGQLIPVDSEHSAIFQCLRGEDEKNIEKLIITASGGPFRTWSAEQMKKITVENALNHPNWSMGAKITVDSATMMNKGLEVIEAYRLFNLPLSKIEAVIHPQSIIHSIVTFVDGSSKAQLGPPTMKVPILYALTYPDRIKLSSERLNWQEAFDLEFEPVDHHKFECFKLALDSLEEGGNAPAILNAANEVAVQRFLDEEISFSEIPALIETCLDNINQPFEKSVTALKKVDQETRNFALNYVI
jgi:1-deoxy-D-xylulose-5-phosphate reductoisomerase